MPQSKILVDTNAYLRLAKTVRPLLFQEFGDENYCLYILPELNKELASRRLSSKFPWVSETEYLENRKHFPMISRKQKKGVLETFEYVWYYVLTELPGPSRVDAFYIAYALELSVPVITDDQDMIALANSFGAEVMPTLELLHLMVECGHLEMRSVQGLVDYWRYIDDRPANLEKDLRRLFPRL